MHVLINTSIIYPSTTVLADGFYRATDMFLKRRIAIFSVYKFVVLGFYFVHFEQRPRALRRPLSTITRGYL